MWPASVAGVSCAGAGATSVDGAADIGRDGATRDRDGGGNVDCKGCLSLVASSTCLLTDGGRRRRGKVKKVRAFSKLSKILISWSLNLDRAHSEAASYHLMAFVLSTVSLELLLRISHDFQYFMERSRYVFGHCHCRSGCHGTPLPRGP